MDNYKVEEAIKTLVIENENLARIINGILGASLGDKTLPKRIICPINKLCFDADIEIISVFFHFIVELNLITKHKINLYIDKNTWNCSCINKQGLYTVVTNSHEHKLINIKNGFDKNESRFNIYLVENKKNVILTQNDIVRKIKFSENTKESLTNINTITLLDYFFNAININDRKKRRNQLWN
jgi:hypothetical protein